MAAGTSIFTLMGSILVDSSKADESISKTEKNAEGLGTKLGNGIKTAAKWGAAVGAGAIAAGTALFGMANKATDALDRIDKLSQKIGISRQGFQEWEYVLSQSGTDIEKLQVGLKTMTQRMDETVKGTGQGAKMFEKLGISVTDTAGAMKSQEEVFGETVRALQNMPDGAEKSRLAFELFGKAGMELMPLLNDNNASLDEMIQNAHDLGLVISDDAVDAGVLFQDTMDDLKRSLGAVMTNIGASLLPVFQNLAEWIKDNMPMIQEVLRTVFEKIGSFVSVAVDVFQNYLLPVFQSIFDWVQENWPAIQEIIATIINAIVEIVTAFADKFREIWDKWGADITEGAGGTWDSILSIIKSVVSLIVNAVSAFVSVFVK